MASNMPDYGFGRCDGHHESQIMLAAATMSMEAPHKRPESIDIAVILRRMLPPFENRGLESNFGGLILLP
jgi:hypothetical protein